MSQNSSSSKEFCLVVAGILVCVLMAIPVQAASIVHRYDFENEDGEDSVGGIDGEVDRSAGLLG